MGSLVRASGLVLRWRRVRIEQIARGMMKHLTIVFVTAACVIALSWTVPAQVPAAAGPRFDGNKFVRPVDYREWTFLASGLGMTYDPPGASATNRPQLFTNVFVNPSAYRGFMESGIWPNGTALMLEIRSAEQEGSINAGGHFQGRFVGLEAHVKDSRFPDGWAFFNFRTQQGFLDVAEPMAPAQAARCVECHTKPGAVERTFVQFYPTLIDVAKSKGTYRQ